MKIIYNCIKKEHKDIYEFYCDSCNEFLGKSEEYDDGYIQEFGEYYKHLYINGWFTYKRTLCKKCKIKLEQQLINLLIDFGFTKDGV